MTRKFNVLLYLIFVFNLSYSQEEMLHCFDFGGAFQRVEPGYYGVTRVYHSPKYLWIDNVTEGVRQECNDNLLRDFVTGKKGEFWIGLDKGEYSITLYMYDSKEDHGAFDIIVQNKVVKSKFYLSKGKLEKLILPIVLKDSVLKIKFVADSGKTFLINGLTVSGKHNHALRKIFNDVPDTDLPSVDELLSKGETDPKKALEQICDWFISRNLPEGFLGDFEPGNFSQNLWWYSSAYPIRTLLAGYELFKKPQYLSVVTSLLDKLITEQMPTGAFQQIYRNKPTKDLTQKDIDFITKNYWMNIADIGCIVTALGITSKYVDGERKQVYINAVKNYCDNWAIKWQRPNGGFTNGMENGVPQKEVYHVSTATSCAAYTVAYAITGEEKYLKVAEKAGEFLLKNWNKDGRPKYHAHYGDQTPMVYDQPINHFGSSFYYSDGLLMLYHHTKNKKILDKMKEVYSNYIKGEKGLLVNLGDKPWFQMQDSWNNSKTGGMPLVFLVYSKMEKDPIIDKYNLLFRKFLCTPEYSEKIGVMIKESNLPWGTHTIQSWSGCSMASTGFAGLSLAEMVSPGLIFLK